MKSKIVDCITFFNENYIFDLRYNIIKVKTDELRIILNRKIYFTMYTKTVR